MGPGSSRANVDYTLAFTRPPAASDGADMECGGLRAPTHPTPRHTVSGFFFWCKLKLNEREVALMARSFDGGLDSLIPTDIIDVAYDPTAKKNKAGKRVGEQVEQIHPANIDPNPHQPRTNFNQTQLEKMAESITIHGILQPLVAVKDGLKFQLVAGERRLRAAKIAGLKTVPVIVRTFTDQQKTELALIENLQREDLNVLETATAYKKLMVQFNLSDRDIGKRVGKDRSTIANYIRLLGLPDDAKSALVEGRITEGHARMILTLKDPAKKAEMLKLIQENGWNVRQTEEFARSFKGKGDKEKAFKRIAGIKGQDEVSQTLSKYLKAPVRAVPVAKGWRVTIDYKSEKDLLKLIEIIQKGLRK